MSYLAHSKCVLLCEFLNWSLKYFLEIGYILLMAELPKFIISRQKNLLCATIKKIYFRLIVFFLCGFFLIFFFYLYFKFVDRGKIRLAFSVWSVKHGLSFNLLGNRSPSQWVIEEKTDSAIYKLDGVFVDSRKSENSNELIITIDNFPEGRFEVIFKKPLSLCYWLKGDVEKNKSRFGDALLYFRDGVFKDENIVRVKNGEDYLKKGDIIEVVWVENFYIIEKAQENQEYFKGVMQQEPVSYIIVDIR